MATSIIIDNNVMNSAIATGIVEYPKACYTWQAVHARTEFNLNLVYLLGAG